MKPVYEPEYNKAKSLLRNESPKEARKILDKRIIEKGETPEYLLLSGVSYFLLDQYREAHEDLEKAHTSGHERYKAAYYLGLCREKENDERNAIMFFREANRLNPGFIPAQRKLKAYGITYEESRPGDKDKANMEYQDNFFNYLKPDDITLFTYNLRTARLVSVLIILSVLILSGWVTWSVFL